MKFFANSIQEWWYLLKRVPLFVALIAWKSTSVNKVNELSNLEKCIACHSIPDPSNPLVVLGGPKVFCGSHFCCTATRGTWECQGRWGCNQGSHLSTFHCSDGVHLYDLHCMVQKWSFYTIKNGSFFTAVILVLTISWLRFQENKEEDIKNYIYCASEKLSWFSPILYRLAT